MINDNKLPNDILRDIMGVDDCQWICLSCHKILLPNKMPPEAAANGFDYDDIDPALEGLTPLEEKCISPRIVFIVITERPSGQQLATRGGMVNVPSRVVKTVKRIPRRLLDSEVIGLKLKRKKKDKRHHMKGHIRPKKVKRAAAVLIGKQHYRENAIGLDPNWDECKFSQLQRFLLADNDEDVSDISDDELSTDSDDSVVGAEDTIVFDATQIDKPAQYYDIAPGEYQTPI